MNEKLEKLKADTERLNRLFDPYHAEFARLSDLTLSNQASEDDMAALHDAATFVHAHQLLTLEALSNGPTEAGK
jgi:hypothetical protein